MRRWGLSGLIGLVLLLSACEGTGKDSQPAVSTSSSSPSVSASEARGEVRLVAAADEGTFDRPVGMALRSGATRKAYIVEQPGRIRLLDLTNPQDKPPVVLDITDRVKDDGNEQGLLGLAFDPAKPGDAYVNYTTATHTVISRFKADSSAPDRLDPSSEQVILTFKQPYANHNGGQLAFGPDGLLYIGTGDGGGAGDPKGNGQNKMTLLGKILRIDVSRGIGGRLYAIPSDNPFANGGGAPEIYAYGLRNPWRFSFDSQTGELWTADVGQNKWEEIDLIRKGGNYGWNIREGKACYKPAKGCAAEGLIDPVYVYGHDLGVSVTGGYVYRGGSIPEWAGLYVYADYATGTVWGLRRQEGGGIENRTLLESGKQITSFGTDEAGEIYVVSQGGGIFKIGMG